MRKVLSDFSVGKYRVLKLDGETPKNKYSGYMIDGKEYAAVPMYDVQNCIAIESSDSFAGKTVEFR